MPRIIGMPYSSSLVSNAFVHHGRQSKRKFNHLEIQKLVFFAHCWSLTMTCESVVAERPEAWPRGPIFASLYHRLKPFGPKAIPLLQELDAAAGRFAPLIPDLNDRHLWRFIEQVFDRYGKFTDRQLSALAHEPDGPWAATRQARVVYMEDAVIHEHFTKKLNATPAGRQPDSSDAGGHIASADERRS